MDSGSEPSVFVITNYTTDYGQLLYYYRLDRNKCVRVNYDIIIDNINVSFPLSTWPVYTECLLVVAAGIFSTGHSKIKN